MIAGTSVETYINLKAYWDFDTRAFVLRAEPACEGRRAEADSDQDTASFELAG
jgi:hypothetical protein